MHASRVARAGADLLEVRLLHERQEVALVFYRIHPTVQPRDTSSVRKQ
jgi:hypothetical protein